MADLRIGRLRANLMFPIGPTCSVPRRALAALVILCIAPACSEPLCANDYAASGGHCGLLEDSGLEPFDSGQDAATERDGGTRPQRDAAVPPPDVSDAEVHSPEDAGRVDASPNPEVPDSGTLEDAAPLPQNDAGQCDGSCEQVNLNECDTPSLHSCDSDPPACNDLDEAPGFECRCPPGYDGSGSGENGCVDIDECTNGDHTCDGDPLTSCFNTTGSFTCGDCPDEFSGDARAGEAGCAPLLSGLLPSQGALVPAFDGNTTDYHLRLKLWEDSVSLTPLARSDFALAVGEQAVNSGEAFTSTLSIGTNAVDITVKYGGATRTYRASIERGATVEGHLQGLESGANDWFGFSVTLSGDGNTLVASVPQEDSSSTGVNSTADDKAPNAGAVYVFRRQPNGQWTHDGYLKASNTSADDYFGENVAISYDGTTIAVSAVNEDSASAGVASPPNEAALDAGAVYVFTHSASGWVQQAYLKSSNIGKGDRFGSALALSDDGVTLAIGSLDEDSSSKGVNSMPNDSAANAGAAYIYTRAGDQWTQQAYLKAGNSGTGDKFGAAIALSGSGDVVAIGAPREDSATRGVNSTPNEGASSAGAAYVFARTDGAWSFKAYFKASNAASNVSFGEALALSSDGTVLAIGASREDIAGRGVDAAPNGTAVDSGAVYVFESAGGAWTEQSYLKASNSDAGDQFGSTVALSRDGRTLAIGAINEDSAFAPTSNDAEDSGAVYVFTRSDASWREQAYLKAPLIQQAGYFGCRVSLSDDGRTLAVGAMGDDSTDRGGSIVDSGASYVF